jgi:hypothetical protein
MVSHLEMCTQRERCILQNALQPGGASIPEEVIVVGITTGCVFDFSEDLLPASAAAVSKATKIVINFV